MKQRIFVVCASVVACGLNWQISARAQWTQYQGDAAHTGFIAEVVAGERLVRKWEATFRYGQNPPALLSPLAVSNQGVFVSVYEDAEYIGTDRYSRFGLTSLDLSTGHVNWTTPVLSYAGLVSAPSLGDGMVYVHDFGHSGIAGGNLQQHPKVVGVNVETGQPLFETTHAGQWSSGSRPTVLGNQVVALGGYYGGIDSYNASTGSHQWFSNLPQQYEFIPAMDQNRVYIYFGEAGASPGPGISTLYALNRATGGVEYTIQNPSDPFTTYSSISSVALGGQNDALVIDNTGYNGPKQVTAFDLQHHTIKWSRALDAINALAITGGAVAVPLRNALAMIDEATGSDLWTWIAPPGVVLISNVLLTDNLAFVASRDTIFGIDVPTGQLAWSQVIGADSLQYSRYSLAYFDGTLYASGSTRIVALQAVPEPSAYTLSGAGILTLFGFVILRRRRRASRQCSGLYLTESKRST